MDTNYSFIMAKRLQVLRKGKDNMSHAKLSATLKEKYGIDISSDSLMNYEVATESHTKAFKNLGMSVKYLRCLADFFGVSTDYLLGLVDNPSPDQSIVAVCQYTGLSPDTAGLLHAYKSSKFIPRLIDAIINADGVPEDLPEAINESAQALAISKVMEISDIFGIQREINNSVATISMNGKNEYYISAEHAAELFLSRAIDIATTDIADAIRNMRNHAAAKVFDTKNADALSVEFELYKVDDSDIPSE